MPSSSRRRFSTPIRRAKVWAVSHSTRTRTAPPPGIRAAAARWRTVCCMVEPRMRSSACALEQRAQDPRGGSRRTSSPMSVFSPEESTMTMESSPLASSRLSRSLSRWPGSWRLRAAISRALSRSFQKTSSSSSRDALEAATRPGPRELASKDASRVRASSRTPRCLRASLTVQPNRTAAMATSAIAVANGRKALITVHPIPTCQWPMKNEGAPRTRRPLSRRVIRHAGVNPRLRHGSRPSHPSHLNRNLASRLHCRGSCRCHHCLAATALGCCGRHRCRLGLASWSGSAPARRSGIDSCSSIHRDAPSWTALGQPGRRLRLRTRARI